MTRQYWYTPEVGTTLETGTTCRSMSLFKNELKTWDVVGPITVNKTDIETYKLEVLAKPGDRVPISPEDTVRGEFYEWEADSQYELGYRGTEFARFKAIQDGHRWDSSGTHYYVVPETEPEPWEALTEKPMLASVELKDPSRSVESFVLTGTWFREDNRVECEQLRAIAFNKEWVVDVEVFDE